MNYFAHGWQFIHEPYFLAGTAVPDWLCVADRKVRVRKKQAAQWDNHTDICLSALARGICQHHSDDGRFHQTRAFTELSLDFTARIRRLLPAEDGCRPWFLGHITVELLLDAALAERQPDRLIAYYAALRQIDWTVVEQAVNRMAVRPTNRLAAFISLFCREQFLWDYGDDGKLLMRLNQVMHRAGLPMLRECFVELLPGMRHAVRQRADELLS
jgi:hypothetical protein